MCSRIFEHRTNHKETSVDVSFRVDKKHQDYHLYMPYWTMVGGLGLDVPRLKKKQTKQLDSKPGVMQQLGVFFPFVCVCVFFVSPAFC